MTITIHFAPWFWHGLAGFGLGLVVGIVGGMGYLAYTMRGANF
jgi:hypothetical protein